jgi:hypothetical protein
MSAMRNPNAVVSTVIRLEPGGEELTPGGQVELEGGRMARLDPSDERSGGFRQVLAELSSRNRPVYVELEPESSAITRLLIPHLGRVREVREFDERRLAVELDRSHALFFVLRGEEGADELERELRAAQASGDPVILTVDDAQRIIDVRRAEGEAPPFERLIAPPGPRPSWWDGVKRCLLRIWRWCWWPWWWYRCWFRCCITPARAQEVFDAMRATTCDPLNVPPPCIPFLYPDDGCWGRAHEMSRLMLAMGLCPKKVWSRGSLHVRTRNNPNCEVYWGWHVAPTLCVRTGFLRRTRMVIDPSLFDTPVTKADWKAKQEDANASLTDTEWEIFHLWLNETDPTYAKTNQVLDTYRLQLKNRTIQHGPPPYAQCP